MAQISQKKAVQSFMLSREVFPERYLPALAKLSPEARELAKEDYEARSIDPDRLGLLWVATLFGCHYLYLERFSRQLLFWITLGGVGIWWLHDLLGDLVMPGNHWAITTNLKLLADRYNEDIARKLIVQYQTMFRD